MTFLIIQGTTEADIVIFETFYKENNFNAGTNKTNQRSVAQTDSELDASEVKTPFKTIECTTI